MSYIVDFKNVSMVGLESSPVAQTLAGLRANEARYFVRTLFQDGDYCEFHSDIHKNKALKRFYYHKMGGLLFLGYW